MHCVSHLIALAIADYVALSSNVTFISGSTDGDKECVNITIIKDGVFETNEVFGVALTLSDGDVNIQNNVTVIRIMDTDG